PAVTGSPVQVVGTFAERKSHHTRVEFEVDVEIGATLKSEQPGVASALGLWVNQATYRRPDAVSAEQHVCRGGAAVAEAGGNAGRGVLDSPEPLVILELNAGLERAATQDAL